MNLDEIMDLVAKKAAEANGGDSALQEAAEETATDTGSAPSTVLSDLSRMADKFRQSSFSGGSATQPAQTGSSAPASDEADEEYDGTKPCRKLRDLSEMLTKVGIPFLLTRDDILGHTLAYFGLDKIPKKSIDINNRSACQLIQSKDGSMIYDITGFVRESRRAMEMTTVDEVYKAIVEHWTGLGGALSDTAEEIPAVEESPSEVVAAEDTAEEAPAVEEAAPVDEEAPKESEAFSVPRAIPSDFDEVKDSPATTVADELEAIARGYTFDEPTAEPQKEVSDVGATIDEVHDVGATVKETPAVEVTVEEAPAVEVAVEETPAVEVAVEEAPAVGVTVEEAPAVEVIVEETPAVEEPKPTPVARVFDFSTPKPKKKIPPSSSGANNVLISWPPVAPSKEDSSEETEKVPAPKSVRINTVELMKLIKTACIAETLAYDYHYFEQTVLRIDGLITEFCKNYGDIITGFDSETKAMISRLHRDAFIQQLNLCEKIKRKCGKSINSIVPLKKRNHLEAAQKVSGPYFEGLGALEAASVMYVLVCDGIEMAEDIIKRKDAFRSQLENLACYGELDASVKGEDIIPEMQGALSGIKTQLENC